MAIDREAWDARIRAAVEELTPQLLASSHDIHANPELAFREHRASARLADELEQGGFAVEREAGGLPTAFRAELTAAASPARRSRSWPSTTRCRGSGTAAATT